MDFARQFVAEHPDSAVILSSNHAVAGTGVGIIDGSVLSLRETTEIVAYCTLLIGCSSGITWASTSEGLKTLPMIQLLVPDIIRSNSVAYDYRSRGVSTDGIIEMTSYPRDKLLSCVEAVLNEGFDVARVRFHQQVPFKFDVYRNVQFQLLRSRRYDKAWFHLKLHLREFGFRPRFFIESGIMFLKCYLPWIFALVSRLRGIRSS